MAVQAYVGTLTRFFSRQWETEAQQQASLTGESVIVINTDGSPVKPLDTKSVEPQMLMWRDYVASGAKSVATQLSWPEGMNPPYFTFGLSWPALGALYLWAAYAGKPGPIPAQALSNWAEDPIYLSEIIPDKPTTLVGRLSDGFWLPHTNTFRMGCDHPYDGKTTVASLPVLQAALDELNAKTWQASEAEIPEWRSVYRNDTGDSVEMAARYTFSVFWLLAAIAQREGLPMTLRF